MITDEKLIHSNFTLEYPDVLKLLHKVYNQIVKTEKEYGDINIGYIDNWSLSMYNRLNSTNLKVVIITDNNISKDGKDLNRIAIEFDINSITSLNNRTNSWNGEYMLIEQVDDIEEKLDDDNITIKIRKLVNINKDNHVDGHEWNNPDILNLDYLDEFDMNHDELLEENND